MRIQNQSDDKALFGIYLNQANLNAYITLCDISERLDKNPTDEDSLDQMAVLKLLIPENKDFDVVESRGVMGLLEKRFPVLEIMYEKADKKGDDTAERSRCYHEILTCLLKVLKVYRNKYSHEHAGTSKKAGGKSELDEDQVTEKLCKYLDRCFDASVRKVKENGKLDEKELLHLRRKISEGRGTRTVDNPKFRYHFKDSSGKLTHYGRVYLANLFLQKRDAYLLMKQISGFKRDDQPEFKATLETFCKFAINLPRPVMCSTVDKNGLALDMLNDLAKCPRELFELLSRENQEQFRVLETSDEQEEMDEIFMRRHSDRFAYFALRYCDENKLFNKVRFQVDLGRYYFKFYDKQTIDNFWRPRALDRQLKTFGRIREVTEKVDKEWKDLIKAPDEVDENNSEPYKARTTPHYHLVDNQIGLVIHDDQNLEFPPELPDVNSNPQGKITLKKPDAWLSIYDLPAMIFHGLTCGFETTEILIKKFVNQQTGLYKKILQTGEIPEDKAELLPKSLKGIGASQAREKDYAKRKLVEMVEETEQRSRGIKKALERQDDSSNKPGKQQYFDIRAGKLADFLARDIMALQAFNPDKKGADKLTSLNFQVLQATLAYYGAKKDTIEALFKQAGVIGGENPHPFLDRLKPREHSSIVRFYEAYLKEKLGYLKECELRGEFDEQFLRPTRGRYKQGERDLRKIAKELLKHPVNIPGRIFQDGIKEFVNREIQEFADSDKYNTAYRIRAWFEKQYGQQQPFHDYERAEHPVVKKAGEYAKKGKNKAIKKILESISLEMSYRAMRDYIKEKILDSRGYEPENLKSNLLKGCEDYRRTERRLRRYRVQDIVTFMMVNQTLSDQLSIEGDALKLNKIMPDNESPFKESIRCKTDVKVAFNTKEDHIDKDYISFINDQYGDCRTMQGNKRILTYRLTSESRKLKDLGKYRRYFYDRRLPGLLIWQYAPNAVSEKEILYEEIEKEIEAYDQNKMEIARKLNELEKAAIASYFEKKELGEKHLPFGEIIERLQEQLPGVGDVDKCDILLKIRNAVYHNQFPVKCRAIDEASGGTIAAKMSAITEKYVDEVKDAINQQ